MVIGVGFDAYEKHARKGGTLSYLAAKCSTNLRADFLLNPITDTKLSYIRGLNAATKEDVQEIAKELIEERS